MSRIAGIIGRRSSDRVADDLKAMFDAMTVERSPRRHEFSAEGISFGWRGKQEPNVAETDGCVAAVDGQIYNLDELGAGDSRNAAQGLIRLHARFGIESALLQINGEFTAALFDRRSRTLWLACDRFRTKPLYYVFRGDWMAFASRPGALVALPEVDPAPNRQFVALFGGSHYRVIDNDLESSPYAQIRRLPAAHVLRFRNGGLLESRYWSLEDGPEFRGSIEDLAAEYRDLLLDAVSLRTRAADRPAFTLSGGMDSSSVLACAVRLTGRKQAAFSAGYVDKTYDELDEARSMIESSVENWQTLVIDEPDVFGLVREMIAVHDEPVPTATWLSHYLLCRKAAELGFGSLFGGLGGDELNAGEYEHFWYFFADLLAARDTERLEFEIENWARHHDHPVFRKSRSIAEATLPRMADLTRAGVCLPDRRRIERYAGVLDPEFFNLYAYSPVMEHPFRSYLKNRTYQDLTRETIPCCLRSEDRHTEAFGLDNYIPFFDYRLVEFMFRVPGRLKYQAGVTKHLLREAMKGILPEETRTRPKKSGWNAPAHLWFAGRAKPELLDLVHSQRFRERGIFNVPEVLRLIEEHERIVKGGERADNHMMFFWQLVNLELWLQHIHA